MNAIQLIQEEINAALRANAELNLSPVVDQILGRRHLFLAGKGRSGQVAKAFANRLMHLGLAVSSLDEITTPSSQPNDLVFIISGSGTTSSLILLVEKAKSKDLEICLLTQNKESRLAELADEVLVLNEVNQSKQPMGTLFEQSSLLVTDALILTLMDRLSETSDSMRQRHADLE